MAHERGPMRDLFLLRPDVVFLNHASFGACPRPVFDAYQRWQREMEAEPVDFIARRSARLLASARARLARYVGCGADDLVLVPNATHGVNVVAHSLTAGRHALGPGDEVLTTDHEYGACARAWRFACARTGATYRPVRLDVPVTTHADLVETLWAHVNERTRVLFLSHITSPTGLILPIRELCGRARRLGILTVIDGAHGPGQVPVDVSGMDADFYAGNCHKWLCAPKGAAFLYARPELQPLVEPLVVSWGTRPEFPGPSRYVDDLEFAGTRDIAAFLTVADALAFQEEHDWDDVRGRCHALLRWAREALLDVTGGRPIHPDDPSWYAQMEALELPDCDPVALHAVLFERHRVEVPAYWWRGRPILRPAIQAYNTPEDVEALLRALPDALEVARA